MARGDEAVVEVAQEDLAIELGPEPEVELVDGLLEREAGVLEPPAELIVLAGETPRAAAVRVAQVRSR